MTASGMTANSSYTVRSGVSVSGGTTWCGINVDGTLSGGSSVTAEVQAEAGNTPYIYIYYYFLFCIHIPIRTLFHGDGIIVPSPWNHCSITMEQRE